MEKEVPLIENDLETKLIIILTEKLKILIMMINIKIIYLLDINEHLKIFNFN